MRSRLRTRAAIAALAAAVAAAVWLALSAALLPQPPAPREILLGAAVVCLCLFIVIGGLAIAETRALRHAGERMRRFLADASHELRTPIAAVQASAETLLRTSPGSAAREALTLQILREGHRAGRLIDDLLAITRLEQGIPLASEHFDLVPLAAAAVAVTRELAPAVDVWLHAPSHARLHGDPQRIRQVLDNLLSNARHATPDGGRITVHVTSQDTSIQVPTPGRASPHPTGNAFSTASPGWKTRTSTEPTATDSVSPSPVASPGHTQAHSPASPPPAKEPAFSCNCRGRPAERQLRPAAAAGSRQQAAGSRTTNPGCG